MAERDTILCFYCKSYGHNQWRCEKRKQDEAVRPKESGGPWRPKVNQVATVKKVRGTTPPQASDPQWFYDFKDVAAEVAPQEDWEQEEEAQAPIYARVNVISAKGKVKKRNLLVLKQPGGPEVAATALVSPTQCRWMERLRSIQVVVGEQNLPVLVRWDLGAAMSSLHVSKVALAVPWGTVVIKAYEAYDF